MSPDPNDEYFADGMTEEMISSLSNISNLTVISRTSTMQYKGVRKNLADIGRELRAGTMLEGSVRKAGNRVRITVQLLDAMEDRHLCAQSYDRELEDVFAVQSEIARSVAEALRVKLLGNEVSQIQKKPTDSTDAYLLYLKGRQHWNKRSEDSVGKAVEYFNVAIMHDPNFAGKNDQALRSLDSAMKLQDSGKIPVTWPAWIFAALHDEDRAFEWLEKGLMQHDSEVASIKTEPWFKELRTRSRFLQILKKLGLDKY